MKIEYVECGPCINIINDQEQGSKTETKYYKDSLLRKNLESNYSTLFLNIANIANSLIRKNRNDNNNVINVCYCLSNYFKKVTPYLVNDSFLTAASLFHGHTDYLTLDLTGNSISHIKFDNPNNLKILLKDISEIINNNSHNNNITHMKVMLKLDIVDILNRVVDEQNLFKVLDELNNSDIAYGVILDSNIYTTDGYKVFNNQLNVNRILDSLSIIKKYKSNKENFRLKVITSDGVRSGEDINNFYKNGADFVTFSTLFITEGPFCVERLINELSQHSINNV